MDDDDDVNLLLFLQLIELRGEVVNAASTKMMGDAPPVDDEMKAEDNDDNEIVIVKTSINEYMARMVNIDNFFALISRAGEESCELTSPFLTHSRMTTATRL